MVRVEDSIIARYEHAGKVFEILVDPDNALKLKTGKQVSIDDLLVIDEIFKDAKQGDKASETTLETVFGTTDPREIAQVIVKDGRVQLTTKQKHELLEHKRKEIIELVSKKAHNPQTGMPHPPNRVESALEQAKVSIDMFKPAKDQLEQVVESLKKILPISMALIQVAIKVPAQYSGKAASVFRKYTMQKEEYLNDGSYAVVLAVPAGLQQELFAELNSFTHGENESKIIGEKK